MLSNRLMKLSITLAVGLTTSFIGLGLTWYQATNSELNEAVIAATEAIRANERLFDEAYYAATQARPLLLRPCNEETRTELSRLAIGIEHIRVINLFSKNNLGCSSWKGILSVKEKVPVSIGHHITLYNDSDISPGVPVMVLRSVFPEGTITTSMTTHWSAVTLQLLSTHRLLMLRVADTLLTKDNQLKKTTTYQDLRENFHVVDSSRYPFSVEYSVTRTIIPLPLFLRANSVQCLLSILLGIVVSISFWSLVLRSKTPYERLEIAIAQGEIKPWYQPVVDTKNGSITGVEVLARWVKADDTVVSPDKFIPLAESTELIIPLTMRLMKQVSLELPLILKQTDCQWHVGINITQKHILEPGFVNECLNFIDAFSPGSIKLTIELTEREPFDSSLVMLEKLNLLHGHGILIALDDFGTGYANFEYINEVNVDFIKIDKAFIKRIGRGEYGERLLESLINMADALKLNVLAEGIENNGQSKWLSLHGVNYHQGYLYSPPVPLTQLVRIIRNFNKTSWRSWEFEK